MKFLAISGSTRKASTNTALLKGLQAVAGPAHQVRLYDRIGELPVFSPDLEKPAPPLPVLDFVDLIAEADALVIASPEYVRAIPGGLKNAIDWLVSRDEVISKPIALAHASHRGDDMLEQLRLVLSTVSTRFTDKIFLRFHLMKLTPEEIRQFLSQTQQIHAMRQFFEDMTAFAR